MSGHPVCVCLGWARVWPVRVVVVGVCVCVGGGAANGERPQCGVVWAPTSSAGMACHVCIHTASAVTHHTLVLFPRNHASLRVTDIAHTLAPHLMKELGSAYQ